MCHVWNTLALTVEDGGTEPAREGAERARSDGERWRHMTLPPGEMRNEHVPTVDDGCTVHPGMVWNMHVLTVEDGETMP